MAYASPDEFANLQPAPRVRRTRVLDLSPMPEARDGSFSLAGMGQLPRQPTYASAMPSFPVTYVTPSGFYTPLPGTTMERF